MAKVSKKGEKKSWDSSEILTGNRAVLGKAISLVESNLKPDRLKAEKLLNKISSHTGNSVRIGITGAPGVGKSTFIEAFGKHLTSLGKKVAVLAIDPSSSKTKGSILGDKTRMEELSRDPLAFIRPSPAGQSLGGVAEKTQETILLCEAAGFEIIIVETVGVGQSETAVRNMVDFFLLLQLAGAGDELQGVKKGIMEMADALVITKCDGDNVKRVRQAQAEFQHALHLFQPADSGWTPKVLTASALEKQGIEKIWSTIEEYISFTKANNFFEENRSKQRLKWFHKLLQHRVMEKAMKSKSISSKAKKAEKEILSGKVLPGVAVNHVLKSSHRFTD
jgi:LAO/AO transport system kinase